MLHGVPLGLRRRPCRSDDARPGGETVNRAASRQRFDAETRALLQERNGVALLLGTLLFPLFAFVDLLLAPESFADLLRLRLITALVCLLCVAINRSSLGQRSPIAVTVLALTALSLLKTLIALAPSSGPGEISFAGHVLLLVAALGFLPLSGRQAALAGLFCLLGYVAPLILLDSAQTRMTFVVQCCYLFSIWIMLVLKCFLDFHQRAREFSLRRKLYLRRQDAMVYGETTGQDLNSCV